VSLGKLIKIHQYVFDNPASFTFIFSGNLNPVKVKPMIEKYLGSLIADNDSILKSEILDISQNKKPAEGKRAWYETGRKSFDFIYPQEIPSASIYICVQGKKEENRINSLYGDLAQALMIKRCGDAIRGKYGASYNVKTYIKMIDTASWAGDIYFLTDPKMAGKMKEVAMEEIKKFMEGDVNEEEVNMWKNSLITKRSDELRSNKWWVDNGLREYYLNNNNIFSDYIQEVKSLTMEGLKSFTKSIYAQGNIIDVVMKSE
jgi:zinc protease